MLNFVKYTTNTSLLACDGSFRCAAKFPLGSPGYPRVVSCALALVGQVLLDTVRLTLVKHGIFTLYTNSVKKSQCFVGQICNFILTNVKFCAKMTKKQERVFSMYTKDKVARITLRLNSEQFDFVKSNSDIMGVSPSEFLRIVVNTTMATSRQVDARLNQNLKESLGRENDKNNINNLV